MDTVLIRAFNHTYGFPADGFNPKLAPLNRSTLGGRFDGTSADPFGVFYCAKPGDQVHVAFWEVMQNELRLSYNSGLQYIPKAKLSERSFAWVRVVQKLKLLNLRDVRAATFFGTSAKVLQGEDRTATRAWATFIRNNLPTDINGFIYSSSAVGAGQWGDAIVLFNDRCPVKPVELTPPTVPMISPPGLIHVERALKGSAVRVGP